jgi:4-hydroxythreonine-4-phosphate dehydrogenase
LSPVIAAYQKKGLAIAGPFPADTMFVPERSKKYDLVIAHYHDQGLIPLKMQAFDSAVNITVGLPIVRTSVDHGTAYDIVGMGKAYIDSLKNAVMIAKKIIRNRKNAGK